MKIKLGMVVCLLAAVTPAAADEGGVSFWLPGQYASFAATPAEAGWSLAAIYFHSWADASGSRSFTRGGRLTAGLDVTSDLLFLSPMYTFAAPVAGGQLSLSLTGVYGRAKVGIDGTLTGPGGTTVAGSQSDSLTSMGDLFPQASLKWADGDHHYMTYAMAGVPVGSYELGRLSNLGTNHWSLDAGGGYTYLDAKKGHEFSAVLGFTYNWENHDTDYKSGTSVHLDWAASQVLSEQWHVGVAGYFYNQMSGDSGAGAVLGDFKSRVSGIGPQVGYTFPVGGRPWYLNLRGYYEFDAKNRPEGWNAWLTLAIPLGAAGK